MSAHYPIEMLCGEFEVSRSGYYAWVRSGGGKRLASDESLRGPIREAFEASRGTYGYPRLTYELRQQGHCVGKNRVARLMRQDGLVGRQKRAFRPRTTQSDHEEPIAPNRLADRPEPTRRDQIWHSDITYVPTEQGWLYLAIIIDAFSRRVIGWAFSESLQAELVMAALAMALVRRGRLPEGVILHSDRGVQYACRDFRSKLAQHRLLASMSRKGNCYDNALAESFFSTLKTEWVHRHVFASRRQARNAIVDYIEAFYNLRRRHSAIGFISPIDFENQIN